MTVVQVKKCFVSTFLKQQPTDKRAAQEHFLSQDVWILFCLATPYLFKLSIFSFYSWKFTSRKYTSMNLATNVNSGWNSDRVGQGILFPLLPFKIYSLILGIITSLQGGEKEQSLGWTLAPHWDPKETPAIAPSHPPILQYRTEETFPAPQSDIVGYQKLQGKQ